MAMSMDSNPAAIPEARNAAAALLGVKQSEAQTAARRVASLRSVLILLALSLSVYLGTSFWPALLDDADASHALVSREMLQRGDFVVLRLNGVRYPQKSPLHYWIVAGLYALLGESEFATRLPAALAMIGIVFMVYAYGRRFFGERAGFYGGIAAATGVGFYIFTRIMIPESIYAFLFTAIFYAFLRSWTGTLDPRAGYWGAAALAGLAMLTRGLIGVIFPVAVIVLFITATGGWRRWRELRIVSSAAIFLAIAVPWHVLAELRAPGFAWAFFINEHFRRALGSRWPPDYDAVPLWIWLLAHLAWLFPWSVFLPLAVRELPRPSQWRGLDAAGQARLLLFLWAGFILLFFSLTTGSRMEYYSFGAWPAIALLLGLGLARAEESGDKRLPGLQAGLAGLGLLAAAALLYAVWLSAALRPAGDISTLLQTRETDFYRLSMAHLLDLRPAAFALLRAPAIGAAIAFGGFTVAWLLRRRRRALPATLSLAVAMVGFFFAANVAYGVFGAHLSSRELARSIVPHLRPQDQIVLYGDFDYGSTISFYTGRSTWVFNGEYNTLGAGAKYPDAPKIFLDDSSFPRFWSGSARVFLFVPPDLASQAHSRLPPDSTYLLAAAGGKAIYVNQRVAPQLRNLQEDALQRAKDGAR